MNREGRSYHVIAPTADLAKPVARQKAAGEGQSNAATAGVIWIGLLEAVPHVVGSRPLFRWEVVLEAPGAHLRLV